MLVETLDEGEGDLVGVGAVESDGDLLVGDPGRRGNSSIRLCASTRL